MVSLDDAVTARLERGGARYEILVDPELVQSWKDDPESVEFSELLAAEEIWSDAKAGDRPTSANYRTEKANGPRKDETNHQ